MYLIFENKKIMSNFTLYTDLVIIVDRSGSMISMNNGHVEQIYSLIKTQQQLCIDKPEAETKLTIITFDDVITNVVLNKNLSSYDIPEIEYFIDELKPRGLTSLFDAVIKGVNEQKKRCETHIKSLNRELRSLDPKINRIVYVITDGYDNKSTKTIENMKELLDTEEEDKYFNTIFLGANIGDVEKLSRTMGFTPERSLTINPTYNGANVGMGHASNLIRGISTSARTESFQFTNLERSITKDA